MTEKAISTRWRKRPVTIDAVQWLGCEECARDVLAWINETEVVARFEVEPQDGCPGTAGSRYIAIDTLEGTMLASPGDWIIRGVSGEHYPCKPEIFAATYEPADDRPAGCCGVCPPILGGGYDCTCDGNPNCPNHKEAS